MTSIASVVALKILNVYLPNEREDNCNVEFHFGWLCALCDHSGVKWTVSLIFLIVTIVSVRLASLEHIQNKFVFE